MNDSLELSLESNFLFTPYISGIMTSIIWVLSINNHLFLQIKLEIELNWLGIEINYENNIPLTMSDRWNECCKNEWIDR